MADKDINVSLAVEQGRTTGPGSRSAPAVSEVSIAPAPADSGLTERPASPADSLWQSFGGDFGTWRDELGATQTASEQVLAGAPVPGENELRLPTVPQELYHIEVGDIARGGLGRVRRGQDQRLGRTVAIKELYAGGRSAALRFVREARVTARLQHPAIVPIYEAGRWPSGELFYTMKLITGRSLKEELDATRTLGERLKLLRHVIVAAQAVAYAHEHRVIHRDLKPANIMLGPFDETLVIDWGLAKVMDGSLPSVQSDEQAHDWAEGSASRSAVSPAMVALRQPVAPLEESDLTGIGTVVGTPHFMSPEQARGEEMDERTDVYSLGVILYQLLTGHLPFRGATAAEVIFAVATREPPPIETYETDIPEDLATIVRKAMARNRGQRYPTARELAADLRNFETGKLVSAHEYSLLLLAQRWLGRHRLPVMFGAMFLFVAAIGGIVSLQRIVDARDTAERARGLAEAHRNRLILVQARTALEHDPTAAMAWVKTYPVHGREWTEARSIALEAQARGVARHVLRGSEERASFGTFLAGGEQFACAGPHKTIELREAASSRLIRNWSFPSQLLQAAFSPDGRVLAVQESAEGDLQLFGTDETAPRRLSVPEGALQQLIFSPDGGSLLGTGTDRRLWLWDVRTGTRRDLARAAQLWGIAGFSPDGQTIAYPEMGNLVRVISVAPERQPLTLQGHTGEVRSFRYSRDSKWLVTGAGDRSVRVWQLGTGEGRVLGHHDGAVYAVAFSPLGTHVASASEDRTVRLWDLKTGQGRPLGTMQDVACEVAFSPDGRFVAAGSIDTTVRLWDLRSGDSRTLRGHEAEVCRLEFSPDGRYLSSVSDDHSARIWELPEETSRVLLGHQDLARTTLFSPDGQWLVSTSRDKTVRLWRLATGEGRMIGWPGHFVADAAFSPDGRSLALGAFDGNLGIWSLDEGTGMILGEHLGAVRAVVFSPDGRQLAAGAADGAIHVWTGRTSRTWPVRPGAIWALAYSPDGRLLASAGADHRVRLWDAERGTEQQVLQGHADLVRRVQFSHNGQMLASGGRDGAVWLWDIASGQGRRLGQHEGTVHSLVFAPDDGRLASGAEDRTIRIWNLHPAAEMPPLEGHTKRLYTLSGSGGWLVSASFDGTARVWDWASSTCLQVLFHGAGLFDAQFSPDGRWVATASLDKVVRLWPVAAAHETPVEPAAFLSWMNQMTTAAIRDNNTSTTF